MQAHSAAGASNRGIGRAAEQQNLLQEHGKSTWKRVEACCFPLISAEQSTNTQPNPHTQTDAHKPANPNHKRPPTQQRNATLEL